ncbi:HIT domain-containing protein [Breoghania sp. L-A4]|uniref:HIT family protein n=1 Tax=Breoghania sp. L-A4 TaxID=2304600 RepID=UPI000E360857|nr:HIT domain-containing protein [Breoghania sp. L-A4]AXS39749.1 HIT domain-containing protein [Breoghania sp. L-A4]
MFDNLLYEAQSGRLDIAIAKHAKTDYRIVHETEAFAILPTVSPITSGHCLIVPKVQCTGFYEVNNDTYKTLLYELRKKNFYRNGYITFEHGVYDASEYRCGVNHAHMHIMPWRTNFLPFIRQQLLKLCEKEPFKLVDQICLTDLRAYDDKQTSYVHVESHIGTSFSLMGRNLPSQIMRNIAVDFGYSCSRNWRKLDNWDLFSETLKLWGTV